jgi:dTDP-4-amino-4,6-dideoxygalactose transaminase
MGSARAIVGTEQTSSRSHITIPVKEEPIPFHQAAFDEAEVSAVSEVVRSGWLTMGAKSFEFEKQFQEYIGAKHAISVCSGTAALHLALVAIGLRAGDEVLVPTTTFTATAEVVTYCGARPVLVDVDPLTMNMDPQDAARRITSRTKAIIPVHFAGQPCDMEEISRLAQQHKLHVIEDAAHSLPARYRGKRVGTISPMTAFSFYATKTLATGEGGMVTTDDDAFAAHIRRLRLHGISRDAWKRYTNEGTWYYEVEEAGYKYNFTDLQAALGLVQLSKCDALTEARRRIAERYSVAFANVIGLEPPRVLGDRTSAWHLYVLRLQPERLSISRDKFIEALRDRGIGVSVHFIPLHLHPFYRSAYGYKPGDLPNAEREYRRCLSLPLFPTMRNDEIDRVIAAVTDIVSIHQL